MATLSAMMAMAAMMAVSPMTAMTPMSVIIVENYIKKATKQHYIGLIFLQGMTRRLYFDYDYTMKTPLT